MRWPKATPNGFRGGCAATPSGLGVAFGPPQMDFGVTRKPPLTATPLPKGWRPPQNTVIFYFFSKIKIKIKV
jgi:hypothetical protein